jgi:hypothetical protein
MRGSINDHSSESYVVESGDSMNAVEWGRFQWVVDEISPFHSLTSICRGFECNP